MTKMVYRDLQTGRLIPKQEAKKRDPASWVQEEFTLIVTRPENDEPESIITEEQKDENVA